MAEPVFAYVGCRTTKERKARGLGINVYRVNPQTGGWTHVQLVRELVNPSFLALDRRQQFLYSVHGDTTDISCFRIDRESGRLEFVNRQLTGGRNPVHLVFDESGRYLIVANYATGTLAVMPIADDGSLKEVSQLVELPGEPGPHRVEQNSAHPHHCPFDPARKVLAIPDKGLDRVFTVPFDSASGHLLAEKMTATWSRPVSAPRHLAFTPDARFAYTINELNSTVTSYRYDAARGTLGHPNEPEFVGDPALEAFQVQPSLPEDYVGPNTGAEIAVAPSGRFVYASNRGHDSIAIFAVDPASGKLTALAWQPTLGKGPRFFALDPSGRFLYAANEFSDTIIPFRIDAASGRLTATGEVIETFSPVCIVFTT